jgi:trans-aconitate methyltransferase
MDAIDKSFWQKYAPLYAKITPSFQTELLEFISKYAYGKVLDAGCGVGKNIELLLANSNVDSITGIERDIYMLNEAKKKYGIFSNYYDYD